jgi:hypothetical protein
VKPPSPAQLRLLEQLQQGATLEHDSFRRGSTVTLMLRGVIGGAVRYHTFRAVLDSGWIEPQAEQGTVGRYYQISEAGRMMLEPHKQEGES